MQKTEKCVWFVISSFFTLFQDVFSSVRCDSAVVEGRSCTRCATLQLECTHKLQPKVSHPTFDAFRATDVVELETRSKDWVNPSRLGTLEDTHSRFKVDAKTRTLLDWWTRSCLLRSNYQKTLRKHASYSLISPSSPGLSRGSSILRRIQEAALVQIWTPLHHPITLRLLQQAKCPSTCPKTRMPTPSTHLFTI